MPAPHLPSLSVRRAIKQLGVDIKNARRLRRLPAALVAERATTSRQTLHRIELGDPSVGIGIYVAVLHALGLVDRVANLAAPSNDEIGVYGAIDQLPKRIRLKRDPKTS